MKALTTFVVVYLSLNFQLTKAYFMEELYRDVLNCDDLEGCWYFVDDYMVKLLDKFKHEDELPCSDFYHHAVGYWHTVVGQNNLFDLIEKVHDQKLEKFIANPIENDKEKSEVRDLLQKLKTYYEQCKAEEETEDIPILDSLPENSIIMQTDWKKVLEGSQCRLNNTWIEYAAEMRRFGLNRVFFEESISIAYNDSTKYVVELKMPTLDDGELRPYFEYVLSELKLGDVKSYKLDRVLENIRQFQELANNVHSMHRITTYGQREPKQLITLGKLKAKVPNIDWQRYFNTLLQKTHVDDELIIQIDNLEYFKDIATLIDQTDDKALAVYILLRFVFYGKKVLPIKYGTCREHLSLRFPLGASYIYDRFIYKTHNEDMIELEKIFAALKQRFSEYISENRLNLTADEQTFLQQKLHAMTVKIGNLPQRKYVDFYNHYYDGVNTMQTFWHNQWSVLCFNFAKEHAKLFENGGHTASRAAEPDNANKQRLIPYFIKSQNRIIVPFEFMRPPFFTHGQHPVFRQSITAFSLARELMEAFGPAGIAFDANGNEHEIGIGILQSPAYKNSLKCLQGDVADDVWFTTERFTDVAGLQLVIDTFFHELPKSGKDASITIEANRNNNVVYDVRELFFLHMAQYFSGYISKYSYKFHDISKNQEFEKRLQVMVSNVPEFAEVFNCTLGTLENPEKKCKIW